jgi:hypothetical protein
MQVDSNGALSPADGKRTNGVLYVNSSGHPITVRVTVSPSCCETSHRMLVGYVKDPVSGNVDQIFISSASGKKDESKSSAAYFYVPPGWEYEVGAHIGLRAWFELQ